MGQMEATQRRHGATHRHEAAACDLSNRHAETTLDLAKPRNQPDTDLEAPTTQRREDVLAAKNTAQRVVLRAHTHTHTLYLGKVEKPESELAHADDSVCVLCSTKVRSCWQGYRSMTKAAPAYLPNSEEAQVFVHFIGGGAQSFHGLVKVEVLDGHVVDAHTHNCKPRG